MALGGRRRLGGARWILTARVALGDAGGSVALGDADGLAVLFLQASLLAVSQLVEVAPEQSEVFSFPILRPPPRGWAPAGRTCPGPSSLAPRWRSLVPAAGSTVKTAGNMAGLAGLGLTGSWSSLGLLYGSGVCRRELRRCRCVRERGESPSASMAVLGSSSQVSALPSMWVFLHGLRGLIPLCFEVYFVCDRLVSRVTWSPVPDAVL